MLPKERERERERVRACENVGATLFRKIRDMGQQDRQIGQLINKQTKRESDCIERGNQSQGQLRYHQQQQA